MTQKSLTQKLSLTKSYRQYLHHVEGSPFLGPWNVLESKSLNIIYVLIVFTIAQDNFVFIETFYERKKVK